MEKALYVLIGAMITFISAYINHLYHKKRNIDDQIRIQRVKIYTDVITQLGACFLDNEPLNTIRTKKMRTEFALRLGKILSPARLIASQKLEEELRAMFDYEVSLYNADTKAKNYYIIADRAVKHRHFVEELMRKEIKL